MTTKKHDADIAEDNLKETNYDLDSKTSLNESLAAEYIRPIANKQTKRGDNKKGRHYVIESIKREMASQGIKVQIVPGYGRLTI